MIVTIVEEDASCLAAYEGVSIGFTVSHIFDDDAVAALLRRDSAQATPLAAPYWKDYDDYSGNRPTDWGRRFDLSRWTILSAFGDGRRVGGAIAIYDDPQIELLRDCRDCALLWDLRVTPAMRKLGVGSTLLCAAQDAVGRFGARAIRVETQQINVPASRLYAARGFSLERVQRGAYRDLPSEIQLLWRKELA